MAGLTREEFDSAASEIRRQWEAAQTRDAGFAVIVECGRRYGYKNVIAAIQGRVPKQFEREKGLTEWVEEQNRTESEE
ncbi:MAG TPA: hypothetical protein VKX16_02685 [Chloroflexota bacterium]|nr:hypothetical protein [Chloroflexota bacterium]